MKLLLTGASGFIGGQFMRRFSEHPELTVLGIGRRPLDFPWYRALDLAEPNALRALLEAENFLPDCVIHAAALSAPFAPRRAYWRNNVIATREVIQACTALGQPRLIYISSSSVLYKPHDQFNLTHDAPVEPPFANTYAQTKAQGEILLRDYTGPYCILRPRAVFGPYDTVLFPRLLRAARKGRLPRIQRGQAPALGDLSGVDLVTDYMLRAALNPKAQGIFNLSHGEPVVIQDFLADLFRQLGLPQTSRMLPYWLARAVAGLAELTWHTLQLPGEPPVTRFGVDVLCYSKTFDISRTVAVLGPPPQTLAEAARAFVEWQRTQL